MPEQREATRRGSRRTGQRTVRRVVDWDGSDCPAVERALRVRRRGQIARALSSFGDGEVHVIYTARDLVRQVPAVWQERLKNQRTMRVRQLRRRVIGRKRAWREVFWGAQDAARALDALVGGDRPADRVHVVTMPPPGTSPQRALGPVLALSSGLAGVEVERSARANDVDGHAVEAELLRRLQRAAWPTHRPGRSTGGSCGRLFDVLDASMRRRSKIALAPDEHSPLLSAARAPRICAPSRRRAITSSATWPTSCRRRSDQAREETTRPSCRRPSCSPRRSMLVRPAAQQPGRRHAPRPAQATRKQAAAAPASRRDARNGRSSRQEWSGRTTHGWRFAQPRLAFRATTAGVSRGSAKERLAKAADQLRPTLAVARASRGREADRAWFAAGQGGVVPSTWFCSSTT